MDSDNKRKLSGCILNIWNDARSQRGLGSSFKLSLKGQKATEDALEILAKDKLGTKFSRQFLGDGIRDMTFALLSTPPRGISEKVDVEVNAWLNKLDAMPVHEWRIIAPIANLVLSGIDCLDVGQVSFVRPNSPAFGSMLAEMHQINQGGTSQQEVRDSMGELFQERLRDRVLAVAKIKTADSKIAEGNGRKLVDHALNVLRLYGCGVLEHSPLDYMMYIGLDGTVPASKPLIVTLRAGVLSMTFEQYGALFHFTITPDIVKKMNDLSLDAISAMLQKPIPTEFEKLLNTSIDFFGAGMHELDPRDAFIDFIISLESLLLKEREPSKGLLAERVALIIESTPEAREIAFEMVEELYQIRSNVVHRGFNDITESNVKSVSRIAFDTIMTLLKHASTIANIDQLVERCNKTKFSGPAF